MAKVKPNPIDAYLAGVTPEQRAALEKLRKQIRAAAPDAEEGISYGVPAFLWNGAVVGFGASKNHCTFFPMTGHTVAAHADELEGFETSKGAIRFTPEKPLPATFVKKIVKERLKENAAKQQ
jgi:uncharacterized protein YdhG (YjbR/CyaY superfamily)